LPHPGHLGTASHPPISRRLGVRERQIPPLRRSSKAAASLPHSRSRPFVFINILALFPGFSMPLSRFHAKGAKSHHPQPLLIRGGEPGNSPPWIRRGQGWLIFVPILCFHIHSGFVPPIILARGLAQTPKCGVCDVPKGHVRRPPDPTRRAPSAHRRRSKTTSAPAQDFLTLSFVFIDRSQRNESPRCHRMQKLHLSKYPPAKPGALVCEPLKAARRSR
jgi:hypothetical protein